MDKAEKERKQPNYWLFNTENTKAWTWIFQEERSAIITLVAYNLATLPTKVTNENGNSIPTFASLPHKSNPSFTTIQLTFTLQCLFYKIHLLICRISAAKQAQIYLLGTLIIVFTLFDYVIYLPEDLVWGGWRIITSYDKKVEFTNICTRHVLYFAE